MVATLMGTNLGHVLSFGLLPGKPNSPPMPPTPPTPPDLGNVLSSQKRQSGPPLGGTFMTGGSGYDKKPLTTGGKTLLGQ